jgi:uncharacterized peroxidase-related enzyme
MQEQQAIRLPLKNNDQEANMTEHYVMQQLRAVNPDAATKDQRDILDHAKQQTGFIPNMYAGMANVPAVLDTYLHGYKLFRKDAGFSPAEQEVIFLAISRVNRCSYCTAAHSMIADKKSGVAKPVLEAIRNDRNIPDARLAALFAFTTEMVSSRGRPSRKDTAAFLSQGYTEHHILGIVLAMAVKTLSNYSNHLFETPLDDAFSAYAVKAEQVGG